MMMQLNREHVLVSKSGLSIQFLKNTPTHVPPRVIREAIALGAEAAEEDKSVVTKAMAELDAAKDEAAARAPTIEAAVRKLLERNQRGDFTAGGRPNMNVLFRETGLQVAPEELEPIWVKVKAEIQ